jgi:hypothetical protein
MNYQTLNLLGIILLCVFGLFFIITTLLFIRFKIISIIGDLTGRTARKQIERIRLENEQGGAKKGFKPSPLNKSRGKLTEPMTAGIGEGRKSGRLGKTAGIKGQTAKTPITSQIKTKDIPTETLQKTYIAAGATDILQSNTELLQDGTVLLNQSDKVLGEGTEILTNSTQILNNSTDVLSNGTEVLSGATGILGVDEIVKKKRQIRIQKSIILTHTTEDI